MSLDSLANSILSESDLTEDAIDEIGEYAAEREMGENFRYWLELNERSRHPLLPPRRHD